MFNVNCNWLQTGTVFMIQAINMTETVELSVHVHSQLFMSAAAMSGGMFFKTRLRPMVPMVRESEGILKMIHSKLSFNFIIQNDKKDLNFYSY